MPSTLRKAPALPPNFQNRDQNDVLRELHENTCNRGEEYYRDPYTGYLVFTRLKHLRRGYCCKNRCRHCPYGFNPDAL